MSDIQRHVRVALRFAGWASPSEEDALFDAVLNVDDRIVGKWSLFGLWSEQEEGNVQPTLYPMAIKADGSVFFGPGDGYSTNVRDKVIRVGELCTFWGDDDRGTAGGEEWSYKIRSVTVLGSPSK